jgi:preprotein translocase subunit SecA
MALFDITSWFGDGTSGYIKSLKPQLQKIESLEEGYKALPDTAFPEKTQELKTRLKEGATLDDILPEAFALVREASRRTLGQRHYDVQLIGGMVLNKGNIAEMRTGEGKTLVATLPTYLNALEEKGVHVVTVNDYLSKRDGSWMGQVYAFLGLTVGVINSQNVSYVYDASHTENKDHDETGLFKVEYEFLKPSSRKESYACDITYGTNNEFGFDYLRDNLAPNKESMVQRGHHYAVVDEIDSILIDESRTPLIIAGQAGDSEDLYHTFAKIAKQMIKGEDFEVDEKLRAISLTGAGITKAEQALNIDNIYTEKGIKYVHHLETAIRAQAVFLKDKDYVVKDGEITIVDAFTGRLQPGRRWNEGLHQAIEAKEGVKIQKETRAIASITFQNYFRFYKKLSGMTGTGKTSEEEFQKVYNLSVIAIPTHREIRRVDHNDQIFKTEKGKFQAIARRVKELHTKGQPVLIGTVSIEKNELLAAYLMQEGIPHTILNAKNHEREGEIIAQAGKKGSVVVATNMAGRGIDIILGGAPYNESAHEEIKALGGLFVLGTERHEARRIDNQLRGRAGRQGDPGETQFFVSLDDDLMRVFGGNRIKGMMEKLGFPDDQPIENKIINRSLENAQKKIEGFNFDARKHTLEYDNVLNVQRTAIYARRRKMLESDMNEIEGYVSELVVNNEEMQKVVEEKIAQVGKEPFYETARRVILYVTDILWTEHLETMEYTRSSVNLRAYGQREPLIEYKKEGLRLFKEMEENFKEQVFSLMKTISNEPQK